MDTTLKQANEHRNPWFEGVQKCNLDDPLITVMDKIVRAEVHRLVVVDNEDRVIGVVSLSDILKELVLKQSSENLFDCLTFHSHHHHHHHHHFKSELLIFMFHVC